MRINPKKDRNSERDARRALEAFAAACRSRGLSVTHQRLAVYEAVLASRSHPAAEEIYRTVKGRYPTISRGTVYRTLETLCELGLVTDVNRVRDTARFEAALDPHHHLVCLACHRIIDLHDDSLDRMAVRARRRAGGRARSEGGAGFEVTGYQIQLVGYCKDCGKARQLHPTEERHGRRA